MKRPLVIHFLIQSAVLGIALNGSLLSQERLEVLKDEFRGQYKAGYPKNEAPLRASLAGPGTLNDVLVNNNNGSTGTSNFTQSETAITAFGNYVVVAFNDAGSFNGNNHFTGWSYSVDGGLTFSDGGTLPASVVGDAGDPVLARNQTTGRIYLSTLGFNLPGTIQMWRSDNDGVSWMAPVNATPGGSNEDKQWHTDQHEANTTPDDRPLHLHARVCTRTKHAG